MIILQNLWHTKPLWKSSVWKYMKYDIKTTYLGVVSHPSFQVYWEPVWHIHHFKSLLNFFFKIDFPQVFNFTCLYTKRNTQALKFWVSSQINTLDLLLDLSYTLGMITTYDSSMSTVVQEHSSSSFKFFKTN